MAKQKSSTAKEFEVSQELKELAEKVINDESLEIHPAEVEYLLVYPNISN